MSYKIKHFIAILLLVVSSQYSKMEAQVAINTDGSSPDASSILDVKSTDKGILVPRLSTTQRTAVSNPATGLLVYDNTTNSFWFYSGMVWTELNSGTLTNIADGDNDTKIQVEENVDEDKIRFDLGGEERLVVEQSSTGATLFNLKNNNENIFIGQNAGKATIQTGGGANGTKNNFIGYNAGKANTIGIANVFHGYQSGFSNINGHNNVFVGFNSGYSNASGTENVFLGYEAGLANTTGDKNTFLGFKSGVGNLSGQFNTFIGNEAGFRNAEGNNNVCVGFASGHENQNGHSNVFLGYRAGYNETNSNRLYIENSDSSSPLIYGEFDNNTVTINGQLTTGGSLITQSDATINGALTVTDFLYPNNGIRLPGSFLPNDFIGTPGNYISFAHVGTSEDYMSYRSNSFYFRDSPGGADTAHPDVYAQNFINYSSHRWKHNIHDLGNAIDVIQQLRGVTYTWNEDHGGEDDFGFIAEEVNEVLPEIAKKGTDGKVDGVAYGRLTPYLVEAIKEQQKIILTQNDKIENLVQQVSKIEELEKMLNQLQAKQTIAITQN